MIHCTACCLYDWLELKGYTPRRYSMLMSLSHLQAALPNIGMLALW